MLTVPLILKAYRAGVFPMSDHRHDGKIFWIRPEIRGIFPINAFHIPKSTYREIKKSNFYITINTDFKNVIRLCAETRAKNRNDTWINFEIEKVFNELHNLGHAHSFETRDENNNLIGGLYGLAIKGAFFGESMFSLQSGASKHALIACYHYLLKRGFTVFDTQFSNPHLKLFGCIDISYKEYDILLKHAITLPVDFLIPPPETKIHLTDYMT